MVDDIWVEVSPFDPHCFSNVFGLIRTFVNNLQDFYGESVLAFGTAVGMPKNLNFQ